MVDSFLDPAGPVAMAQRSHLMAVVALTLVAVLPVIVLVPFILWRYRSSNRKARYAPQWDRSGKLELLLWGVPFLIVTVLSVLLWRSTLELDPYKPVGTETPLRVEVIGLDWKWLFLYPDLGIATVGELVLPARRPVQLTLTADTVMQSFIVPALAGQIYAMPGMTTRLNLEADAPGNFKGANIQYNGAGFHAQRFRVKALSVEDFSAWRQQVRSSPTVLGQHNYAQLAQRSTAVQAQEAFGMTGLPAGTLHFRLTDGGLFRRVLQRYRSGSPVSAARQPGSAVYAPEGEAGAR
ncbi:MAG: cytochrome ubiquinol oxidase subunit II [Gammaproteobacteria bacterium]|nr:cytochrome ubiquinol oxidase subunit II [Gammaproteobacteria bacterium]